MSMQLSAPVFAYVWTGVCVFVVCFSCFLYFDFLSPVYFLCTLGFSLMLTSFSPFNFVVTRRASTKFFWEGYGFVAAKGTENTGISNYITVTEPQNAILDAYDVCTLLALAMITDFYLERGEFFHSFPSNTYFFGQTYTLAKWGKSWTHVFLRYVPLFVFLLYGAVHFDCTFTCK